MKVVIAGAGTLGRQVAGALGAAGNEVTMVEVDEELAAGLGAGLPGVSVVTGDACELGVLEAAGVLRADVVVAVTGSDEHNLVISLLSKRRCQVAQVVARINDPGNRWLFDDAWGVDVAVSAAASLVALIEEATRSVTTVDLLRLRRAGLELIETTLAARSRATGRRVGELGLPAGVVVTSVVRDGRPIPGDPGLGLQDGDQLLILAPAAGEVDVEALFQ